MSNTDNFMVVSSDCEWVGQVDYALDIAYGDDREVAYADSGESLIDGLEEHCEDCETVFSAVIIDAREQLWSYMRIIHDIDNWPLQRIILLGRELSFEDQARSFRWGVDFLLQTSNNDWWKQLIQYIKINEESSKYAGRQ